MLARLFLISTDRQGQSGLGLEAMRAKVEAMASEKGAVIVAELVEVESARTIARSWPRLLLRLVMLTLS